MIAIDPNKALILSDNKWTQIRHNLRHGQRFFYSIETVDVNLRRSPSLARALHPKR